MRCTQCGNEIPGWANDICYVCGRISREERRYGRHISGYAQAHHKPDDEFPVPQPAQRPPTRKVRPAKRPPPDTASRPLTKRPASWSPQQQRCCRQGINRLLAAIYDGPHFLSQILRDSGLDNTAVSAIGQRHLISFLQDIVQGWDADFTWSLPAPEWSVLVRLYSLDGRPPRTLTEIALELHLSSASVQQLEKSAISHLHDHVMKNRLEGTVICAARRCLNEHQAKAVAELNATTASDRPTPPSS